MTKRHSPEDVRASILRDREKSIEGRYTYDREGFKSTLAYVTAFRFALAREYLDKWRPSAEDHVSIRADLPAFERERLGSELEVAAHGILLHAVLLVAFPNDDRFRRSRLHAQEPSEAFTPGEYRPARPVRLPPLGDAVENMPEPPDHEQRVNELTAQARAVEGVRLPYKEPDDEVVIPMPPRRETDEEFVERIRRETERPGDAGRPERHMDITGPGGSGPAGTLGGHANVEERASSEARAASEPVITEADIASESTGEDILF